jgi:quercetin dioxygenase-like cupin family protein
MTVPAIHESEATELDLPGRALRWLVDEEHVRAQHCSVCLIRIEAGGKVHPAHSHPHGEEVVYVVHGSGRALVNGEVAPIRAGSLVLFPQGQAHMLHNTGKEEMKVICFFAPATRLENYKMHEDVDFPDNVPRGRVGSDFSEKPGPK